MKNAELIFLKSLQIESNKLTEESRKNIKKEAKSNQFEGYFKWQTWRSLEFMEIFDFEEGICVLEYVLYSYLNILSEETKLDLYRMLLGLKMQNKDCQSGLAIISMLEEKFAKDLFILNVKGSYYRILGWHKDALETFYSILEVLKNNKNIEQRETWKSSTNYNIAIVHAEQKDFQRAIDIFEKHLALHKKEGDEFRISLCFMNLGHVHSLKKDFKKAIEYNSKAQKIKEKLGDRLGSEQLNMNIALMYVDSNDLSMAEKYIEICKNAQEEKIKVEAVQLELIVKLKRLAEVEEISDADKKALYQLAEKTLKNIEDKELDSVKVTNLGYISEAYKRSGHFSKAIKILEDRHQIYKESVEKQKARSYEQIRTNHEFHLQQKELEKTEMLLKQEEEMNIKLKHLNDELEQFTYMASHDLKSPLRTILAICGLIKDDELSKEELHNYLEIIKSDALKINTLVTALLGYSKIGYTNVEMKKTSLNSLLNRILKRFETERRYKNANIIILDLPDIEGNEMLLEQLFQNIIDNALKYNTNKVPEIKIRAAGNKNIIEIIDNGIGISKNKIHEIFKAFTRAHSASKYEGSGIGLATSKKIMDIHSGTISVHSEENKGSTFILRFKN